MKLGRMDALRLALALAAIAVTWAIVRDAPFLSEDWTHLAEARGDAGWTSAFDLAREPLRPLQHLLFHVLALDPGIPNATAARALSFVLHLGACALVFALALELAHGAERKTVAASGAALLFTLAPNVKGIAWSAAISTPGRALFVLLGLVCFARALRTCSKPAALGFVGSFVLALLFHESAIVLPALCLAWAAVSEERTLRLVERARAALAALRRPELALVAVATLAYVLYLAFLRPERHHALKSVESLPANAVKAALALFPELVRANVVDFLRAHPGAVGLAAGAALFAALSVLAWGILVRGSRLARFALVAVALDLVLPTLGTGFNQRYAYLGSAFAALALAEWAARTARPVALLFVLGLGGAWALDSLTDAEEYADAGRRAQRLLITACLARVSTPEPKPVAIVDPPDVLGAERDLPVFNWGLAEALDRGGCGRAFVLWRTRTFATSTDVELVTPERVRAAEERGEVVIVRGDGPSPAFPSVHDE